MSIQNDYIYLDDASTSPVRQVVKDRVVEMLDMFGNPSSLHRLGMEAETQLKSARERIASALGAKSGRIVFAGSGTEANNLAILGSAYELEARGKHIVTTAVEHPAVLEPIRYLEQKGWQVTYVQPDAFGDITAESIESAIQPDTTLVSVMHVNNETGTMMPVSEIAEVVKVHRKIRFHVDGTQAFGKLPFSVAVPGIDTYAVSAHKIGALKGSGGLYMRNGLQLHKTSFGGGQEFGVRSGTENVLGAEAFATAAMEISSRAFSMLEATAVADWFVESLSAIPGWVVHRSKQSSPFIVNASLLGLRGEVVVHAFEQRGLFVSSGSACSTAGGNKKRSYVLRAMRKSDKQIDGAVRFSWSRDTTREALERALEIVKESTEWLQSMVRI